jgi:aryl-alcohol dehydrogenase-like predicted oxidoreductase
MDQFILAHSPKWTFMRYRTLGRTGLSVSEISLGTVELGLDYGISAAGEHLRPGGQAAGRLLHRALDAGINLIDTARTYGDAEELIGKHLQSRRGEYSLVTKVPLFLAEDIGVNARVSRMRTAVEESLQRLCSDSVDVLLLHLARENDPLSDEYLAVLDWARDRGYTRFIGASVYGPDAALAAIGTGRFDCLQLAYSLIDRRVEHGVLAAASSTDTGLMLRSVLMKGALTHRWTVLPAALEEVKSAAATLQQIAVDAGMDLPELAYRYVLANEGPVTALAGTARLPELESCIRYTSPASLPTEVVSRIRRVNVSPSQLDLSRWPTI